MRIAIVDDEVKWQEQVKALINEFPWEATISIDVFSNGEEFCKGDTYDVVFMDIEMPKMDGFEAASRCKEKNKETMLVFLTTHTELSRRGYLVNAFRYIDKGNIDEELKEAFVAIADLWNRNYVLSFHMLRVGDFKVPLKEVNYIETTKRNVLIHTKDENYISNSKMEELEEELKEHWFFRSHKSYLVNVANVVNIGKEYVDFKNGDKARISRSNHSELVRRQIEYKFRYANS